MGGEGKAVDRQVCFFGEKAISWHLAVTLLKLLLLHFWHIWQLKFKSNVFSFVSSTNLIQSELGRWQDSALPGQTGRQSETRDYDRSSHFAPLCCLVDTRGWFTPWRDGGARVPACLVHLSSFWAIVEYEWVFAHVSQACTWRGKLAIILKGPAVPRVDGFTFAAAISSPTFHRLIYGHIGYANITTVCLLIYVGTQIFGTSSRTLPGWLRGKGHAPFLH